MKEKTRRRLRLLARVMAGIFVALVVLALVLVTHTQIVVGAIQTLSASAVKTTNTFESEGEPMDATRDNGQRIVTEIAYADEYPNSFLDITYPDADTSVRRPTLFYFHGGGFFGGSKSMGDPLASSDVTSLLDDICAAGYNVVNVDYGLVPDCRFPVPVIQANQALAWCEAHAEEHGLDMDDASTDVYQYVLCSICPVKLSKAALCYNAQNNTIEERIRDWIVDMPSLGFLFPAFNDRNTDLHSLLYYSKNAEELHQTLIDEILGCVAPLSAKSQKETFNSIIQETLGPDCDYEAVKTIHEKITEMVDEHADEPEPLTLDKYEVKKLLQEGGATKEDLEDFDERYDDSVGEKSSFLASNISSARKFEIKTPDVVIQVNPERTDLVETQVIDGRTYLMIEVTDSVEVNGLSVRPISHNRKKEPDSALD